VPIRCAVETGTYKANSTRKMAFMFPRVYTIEIGQAQFDANAPLLACMPHVSAILGDSAEIVPLLAKVLQEPVLWYLDAHWFPAQFADGVELCRDNPFPLWAELEAIRDRKMPDLVLVDDVHAMGREDWGPSPPDGVVDNWVKTSHEAIKELLGDRVLRSRVRQDKVICFLR